MAADLRLDRIAFPRVPAEAGCLVAEVPSRNGAEVVTVLVRIEPGPLPHEEISARIGQSLKALRLCYGEPVLVSVVFLQGGRSGVRLESGVLARCARMEVARIYFSTFALSESRAERYLERPEPLSWALAARMRPRLHAPDDHRRACLERIAAADLAGEARALLRRWVEAAGPVSDWGASTERQRVQL